MQSYTMRLTDDELIAHLSNDGGALWVPGAKPHCRNEPVLFAPYSFSARRHPLNSEQTPVLLGTLVGVSNHDVVHCVALAHLAHDRGSCARCDTVWRTADEHWAGVPDEGNHEALFGSIELQNRTTGSPYRENRYAVGLLVHIDDIPADWYDD